MEKINDLLKSLLGILLLISFVIIFSSCEKKSPEGAHKDTTESKTDSLEDKVKLEKEEFQKKMKEESEEMDMKYDSLKTKAKAKGAKAEKGADKAIANLKEEKDKLMSRNTEDKVKDDWEKFKEKSKAVVDSIGKKL